MSIKLAAGINVPGAGGTGPTLAPVQQARLAETERLARIRAVFELEQKIEVGLAEGTNVADLRRELDAIRSGRKDVELRLARDPKPHDGPVVTVARQKGPEKASIGVPKGDRRPPKPRLTPAGVLIDLKDISRGKLTLSGIAIVKTMLDRFDLAEIAKAIDSPEGFLARAAASPTYTLASALRPIDALVVVQVLEETLVTRHAIAVAAEARTGTKGHADRTT